MIGSFDLHGNVSTSVEITREREGYLAFLTDSADPETREHIEVEDQVREVLIHGSYMSLIDLAFCAEFDIDVLSAHPHFAEIEALHAEVKKVEAAAGD